MRIPAQVTTNWATTLPDDDLLKAEATLHATFTKEEKAEKKRRGDNYVMLRGPESLVMAWHRWLSVNNETTFRGLKVRRASSTK
jgi:hypothetical protein